MVDQKLQFEKKLTAPSSTLFLVSAITGLCLLLVTKQGTGSQLVLLLHLVVGIGFVLLMLPYLPVHFVRTAYFRRPALIVTGLLATGLLLAVAVSGFWMMLAGQREDEAFVPFTHLWAGILILGLVLLHIADHFYRMPAGRKQQYPLRFLVLKPRAVGFSLLLSVVAVAGLLLIDVARTESDMASAPAVSPYDYSYGDHPFRPSQTETSHGGFVAEREIAESEACAECHSEIADQWSASLHRQAASDPTYVTNVNLLEAKKGIAATRYCEGCHAPVALLTGELSEGGLHGGVPGTTANLEGVSCLSCHGVSNLVHLKGVASFEFSPVRGYLFDGSDNVLGRALNRVLIRTNPEQHKKDLAQPVLHEPAMCAACHAQFMDKDINDWGWVKMQDDYSAWLAGPFSGHESEFSASVVQRCQDCHMAKVKANDPSADASGFVASHNFPGGNTVVPLLSGDQKQYEASVKMLQNNGIRLTINQPNRTDAQQDLRALNEQIRGLSEAPYYTYLGEEVSLDVIVANQGIGHDFPAGTIDLGEAWIEFVVIDAEGDVVFESGVAVRGAELSKEAHVYKSIPIDRRGEEVWRHDLFNMVGESFRRVIKAGEADLAHYTFQVPAWVKSPLSVSANLHYRKLNERYARFALGDAYFPVPIVTVASDSLSIPVRIRSEIDPTAQ